MAAGGEETVAVRPEVVAIGEQRVGGRELGVWRRDVRPTRGQSTAIRELQSKRMADDALFEE